MSLRCMDHALTADIYIELRRKVDFKEYKKKDVEIALANSLYSIVVFDEERPIGIARIVGDGRIAFFIKDVVVDPAYQKNRIGNLLMEKLTNIWQLQPVRVPTSVSCLHRTAFPSIKSMAFWNVHVMEWGRAW